MFVESIIQTLLYDWVLDIILCIGSTCITHPAPKHCPGLIQTPKGSYLISIMHGLGLQDPQFARKQALTHSRKSGS